MRRFDLYMLREGITPFLFGLLLYSSLAIISATLPRLQWLVGAPSGALLSWFGLQFPTALVQALPIALLLAVLLACGRLAADNELLAVQSGGVALRRVTSVFVALGFLATVVALCFNQLVLPATQARVGSLFWELSSGKSALFRLAGRTVPFGDFALSFQRTDRRTGELLDVRVVSWRGERLSVFLAQRAQFVDAGLQLFDYQFNILDLSALDHPQSDTGTLLRQLVLVDNRARNSEQSYTITTSRSVTDLVGNAGADAPEDTRSILEAYRDARRPTLDPSERRRASVQFHRKLAEPFANLSLLLIAVPLAVLYARSRAVAFGLSLGVTLAWYLLLTFGQLLAQSGWLPVWLGLWAGNMVLAGAGLYLLLARTGAR